MSFFGFLWAGWGVFRRALVAGGVGWRNGEGIVGAPGGPCPTVWLRVGEMGCECVAVVWRDALFAMLGYSLYQQCREGKVYGRVRAKDAEDAKVEEGGDGGGEEDWGFFG